MPNTARVANTATLTHKVNTGEPIQVYTQCVAGCSACVGCVSTSQLQQPHQLLTFLFVVPVTRSAASGHMSAGVTAAAVSKAHEGLTYIQHGSNRVPGYKRVSGQAVAAAVSVVVIIVFDL